jgi:RNA polymerase sigma-70 factor (ECF subfamily)
MSDALLERARVGDETAFRALTEPHFRELHVHCYRLLGSVQDAEDLVQETLLAAWRGLAEFEGRSSLRAWLYRIATNRCLNAMRASAVRPQRVIGAGPPSDAPDPTRRAEPVWLQPYPDALLDDLPDEAAGPDARYESKEAVGLAFVWGLQRMAPQQRAVLVLRDVLGYRAAEVAEMLGTTQGSVTSALQRARTALDAARAPSGERALPGSPAERELVARFGEAFERGDIDAIVAMLTDDAWVRMPPEPHEYQGHDAIAAFLRTLPLWREGAGLRLVPTRANGQPAFAYYLKDPSAGVVRASGLFVLTLSGGSVSDITRFGDTGVLPWFGLPRSLPDRASHGFDNERGAPGYSD